MPDSDKIQYADKDSYFSKLSVWLTIIATVAVTAFLILLGVTENTEVTQIRQENGYTCVEDYHCQEITDDNAPIGVRKEYTFTLDNNIATDTTLAFYTVHQYVEVWLWEEKVFSIMPSKDNHMIKTVGSNWTMIPVMKWMEGYLTKKSRMILNYYCIGAASLCLVQLILQFSGILDIREYLYVTHVRSKHF